MINLLLLNNFYPVTSYRRVQKEKESDELLCMDRSLVMVREPVMVNLLRWNDVPRTFRHFVPKLQYFLSSKYIYQAKQITNLLLLNNLWYHTDEFKRKRKRRTIVHDLVTRYGPRISWRLTSCAEMTCHARRESFLSQIATFPQF